MKNILKTIFIWGFVNIIASFFNTYEVQNAIGENWIAIESIDSIASMYTFSSIYSYSIMFGSILSFPGFIIYHLIALKIWSLKIDKIFKKITLSFLAVVIIELSFLVILGRPQADSSLSAFESLFNYSLPFIVCILLFDYSKKNHKLILAEETTSQQD